MLVFVIDQAGTVKETDSAIANTVSVFVTPDKSASLLAEACGGQQEREQGEYYQKATQPFSHFISSGDFL
jgi:hypothetical protein